MWHENSRARAYLFGARWWPTTRLSVRLHVKIEPSTIDGVKVFVVTPNEIPPENRNRLLIHIHGGCYVLFPGEAGATEAS